MVTKNILTQYIDLTKEIKEVKEKIDKTKKAMAQIEEGGDVCVKERNRQSLLLSKRIYILSKLETKIFEVLNEVEEFILSIPDSRMRRIINLKFIENLSWRQVADKMGGRNTENGIKSAFHRFIEKC